MIGHLRRTLLLLAPLALLPTLTPAYELDDGRLELRVTGQVGYGRTDHNSTFSASKEGNYDNSILAMSVAAQLSDRLRVVGRFDIENEGAEIDWAFAEWKVSDALRFRAGMGKHAFGNYGEILEEGTLRPFFDAPQSIYGPANIAGEGYTGLGITGFHRFGRWGFLYDLYGGELDVETSNALLRIGNPLLDPTEDLVIQTRDMVGARLTLETPLDGLAFRLSAYSGLEEEYGALAHETRHSAGAASFEFLGESLSLRAEYAHLIEKDFAKAEAMYAEAAWKFAVGVQLAARVEGNWTKLEGFTGSSRNLRHEEAAVGLNYWFSPDFVLKTSFHLIDGNRFTYAPFDEGFDPAAGGAPPEPRKTTQLIFVGAQFSL
jgi:hypothetical protein